MLRYIKIAKTSEAGMARSQVSIVEVRKGAILIS